MSILFKALLKCMAMLGLKHSPKSFLLLQITSTDDQLLRIKEMSLTLRDDASQEFQVVLADKFGNTVASVPPLTVISSDDTVATATLSADGASLVVAAAGQGKLGSVQITVSDAADNLSIVTDVTVTAGTPVGIALVEVAAALAAAPVAAPVAEAVPAIDPTAAVPESAPAA